MNKTAIVLLAAGGSSRMGSPKQLLHYNGKALLRHAAETALASRCGPVILVLGSQGGLIVGALEGLPLDIVHNPRWAEGMGTSIKAGIHVAASQDVDGAILALGDQPLITSAVYDRLAEEHAISGMPIVTSQYAGTVGVPVYFNRSHFCHLLALEPGQGCKGVILSHGRDTLRIDCPEAEADVDTPQDYERLAVR